jgi:hypothetical protein
LACEFASSGKLMAMLAKHKDKNLPAEFFIVKSPYLF